jgi:hypothetical protein
LSYSKLQVAATSPLRFVTTQLTLVLAIPGIFIYWLSCIKLPEITLRYLTTSRTTHRSNSSQAPKNSDFATPAIPVSPEAREVTQGRQLRERRDSLCELTGFWVQPGSRGDTRGSTGSGCLSGCISSWSSSWFGPFGPPASFT